MPDEPWEDWVSIWKETLDAVRKFGGDRAELTIEPPASESEVRRVERKIRRPLPTAFREVVLRFSRSVWMDWSLWNVVGSDVFEFLVVEDPTRLERLAAYPSSGGVRWSLDRIVSTERWRKKYWRVLAKRHGGDAVTEGRARWRDCLAWISDNKTMWAFDLRTDGFAPVVSLEEAGTKDDKEVWLAHDFIDLVGRWSRLCGLSVEGDWEQFHGPAGLDPGCDAACTWRELLGVGF